MLKKRIAIQAAYEDVLKIIEQQLRRFFPCGYCKGNKFKLYKTVAYMHKPCIFLFCIYGKIWSKNNKTFIEYRIRPNYLCVIPAVIFFSGFGILISGAAQFGMIHILLLTTLCVYTLFYTIVLISQGRTCEERFKQIIRKTGKID